MLTNVSYRTASTAADGGYYGHYEADDSRADHDPRVQDGPDGAPNQGMDPEKLFAFGYTSRFMAALRHHAELQQVKVPASTSAKVSVGIGPRAGNGFGLDVQIIVAMPDIDRAQAKALIQGAHHICPYSHVTSNTRAIAPVLA